MMTKSARRTPIGNDTQLVADPHDGAGDDRSNRVGARRFRAPDEWDGSYKLPSFPFRFYTTPFDETTGRRGGDGQPPGARSAGGRSSMVTTVPWH
jgi:hypothetical protein